MLLLFVVPISGLVLIATRDYAWLPLHVGAHVTFFVALAAHLLTAWRGSSAGWCDGREVRRTGRRGRPGR